MLTSRPPQACCGTRSDKQGCRTCLRLLLLAGCELSLQLLAALQQLLLLSFPGSLLSFLRLLHQHMELLVAANEPSYQA